ncbi:chemotaxis protein CheA [Leptospira biflexa]|uniref:Chemotaxis protein CheA n=1 Tax=Leptospira biflexa serovar Patoc (strain Patoc 1 / ATCC 23582 / Paris) TaxID=456481 RepID=B0SKY9_LEPBP|nr:chemotaxis protein CheW [Leptospira biflexa]ABZ94814.1 Chemotaxis protein histidine kinase [Leptospira biflexa serovar Patoc strain 'Patoc 1 (Ames)']ABZ98482.1 chemotaxis protein CheA [Leptospira biflexa serovar Patoc strain 'Patoc 1 (Paris)']TGM44019.1 chemotaxis protein CheA [Leptospira biflexa]TGM44996.1 chemotaxis protein CheA [Leptospira biflexa]TGM57576.1 chemotaxis protein CheA [Leptospira biflexa]
MAGILGEYTEVFLEESEDQIEELNSNLVKLEKDHENPEIINDIFRAAHSLKSSSAFVGLYNLSDLAHTMENLLQKIREGSLEINVKLVNLLFECFDLIKQVIEGVANGVKVETPFTDMIQKLQDYEVSVSGGGGPTTATTKTVTQASGTKQVVGNHAESFGNLSEEEISEIRMAIKEEDGLSAFSVDLRLKNDTPMQNLRLLLILQSVTQSGVVIKCNPTEEALDNGQGSYALSFITVTKYSKDELYTQCNIDMVETLSVQEINIPETEMEALEKRAESSVKESNSKVSSSIDTEEKVPTKGSANFDKAVTDSKVVMRTIKVSSDKLDQLMNNVGELVITNSGFQKIYDDLVAQFGEDSLFNELKGKIDQINRISKDLQTGIMNIRMVPIGSVFNRFTRLIRDLSLETGKQVNLVLRGENTELDKKVIDAIGEPLIHLIRNSVDHGIESPEERKLAGKSEEGTVELNAYQGGSNILVEIRDDGKGLSKNKILQKAIERGLVTEADSQNLSESDIFQFIFAPGFSTADKISDISGRGVGMNVVNKLIEEFKGKIIIHSEEGKGSSFTLSFPQALAIIPSILVIMEEEVYAFPLSEVSETIKVNLDQITTLEGHEIINLRGEVLPIYRLNRILGLADKQEMLEVPVVIVNYKTRKLGFMVDDLIGKHETVIKSLGKNFKDVQGLTGATIMGDGTIILVLDIPGLVEIAADKVDWTDKLVSGEMMKRSSTIRSLEMSDSEYIFKSNHPTNRYNAKLIELRAKDKSRTKKEKHKIEKHIIVPKEEVYTEEPVTNQKITTEVSKKETTVNGHSEDHSTTTETTTATLVLDHKTDEIHRLADVAKIDNVKQTEREQAAEIIKGFVEQKEERLNQVAALNSDEINQIMSSKDIKKLENIVNTGMMNAGVVLSQLVGKEVELFIPEIKLTDRDGLAKEFRYSMDQFFGMKIRMTGDLNGNLLMMFSEENGSEIAKELLGSEEAKYADGNNHKLSDDMMSVLSEISNIVCSSVMNSLSNKLKKEILPSVPEMITGSFMEVVDIVKPERTKFLSMHTEFNHQGSNLIGVLVFLPDFDELVELIHKS